jgi:ABC-type sulfate transport system substrate-binding protein
MHPSNEIIMISLFQYSYRPTDPAVAAKFEDRFAKINLVSIGDLGGWPAAQKKHFSDWGVFDQINGAKSGVEGRLGGPVLF